MSYISRPWAKIVHHYKTISWRQKWVPCGYDPEKSKQSFDPGSEAYYTRPRDLSALWQCVTCPKCLLYREERLLARYKDSLKAARKNQELLVDKIADLELKIVQQTTNVNNLRSSV